jgi:biotin carboxylase
MPPFEHALVLTSLENLGLTMIRTLSGAGIKATIAGAGPARMLRLSRHCSAFLKVAETGAEYAEARRPALEAAASLARRRGIDLVVPVDVPGGLFASSLRPLLPDVAFFPFTGPETLKLLDNKWTFYGLLREYGIPTPRTWLLEDAEQARGLPLPLVIKPLAEAGGKGVSVVRDAAARDARLTGTGAYHRFPTLAQEYVDGEEVSLSFLADRGKVLAWSVHLHRDGGAKEYIDDERVIETGRQIAAAVAYHGVANVDMRYTRGREKVLVIECNPRFWGTFKYTLGLGIDYLDRGLALIDGRSPSPFVRAPVALVPGLAATVRDILKGRLKIAPASRPYLRQKLADPAPEVYWGVRHLLGIKGEPL